MDEVTEYRAYDKTGGFSLFSWRGSPVPPLGVDEEVASARFKGRDIVIEESTVSRTPWQPISGEEER